MRGIADRQTDERDLLAIRLVTEGHDRNAISLRTGMTKPYIGAVLSRISMADAAESGEPHDLVRLAYLPPAKPTKKQTSAAKLRGKFSGRF